MSVLTGNAEKGAWGGGEGAKARVEDMKGQEGTGKDGGRSDEQRKTKREQRPDESELG